MILKEELLDELHTMIKIEEDMITLYSNFSKALLKRNDAIEIRKKEEMEQILSRLYRESAGHRTAINKLIEEVTASGKDEY